MGLIFILLAIVLIWALWKTKLSDSRQQGTQMPDWESTKDSKSDLEQIRRQVWEDKKHQEAAEIAKREQEVVLSKQESLARQKSLEDKYFNSPVTRQIIDAISDGTGRLPEEITIYDDCVTGCTNGQMRTFGFAINRVPVLDQVYKCMVESGEEEQLLRPQVALGNAINHILNGQYDVSDKAIRRLEQRSYSDGEIYFLHHYTSDHVLLRLKATNHW